MSASWWKGKLFSAPGLAVLLAQTGELGRWDWDLLLWDVVRVVIYVLLGLAFFAVAYLILDKATPFSFGQELRENKNTAMAIVLGSVFLGIALILAAAIRG